MLMIYDARTHKIRAESDLVLYTCKWNFWFTIFGK